MAALTSTQSGNFNSSSTWGGTTPADGDTFTISRGHEVIVNSDIRTTNGYGDIQVYGHLKFETNGKMRLNGRITVRGYNDAAWNVSGGAWFTKGNASTAGLFSSSGNNMVLEVRGSQSDNHGIWVETERFASMKLTADDVRTLTTSDAAMNPNANYIPVTSASGFAAGDWVAIYKEQEDNRVLGDEGFFVHDVDTTNGRLYIRQFVTPTSEITAVSGSTVTVENARVFRKNYEVICGTGSDRKVATINSINYAKNQLTMSVSFASANVGQTLYQTGAEKYHNSGKKVEKIATTLTTAITSTNSTNQITVGSANDLAVGDTIIIDVNNDSDFNWDYNTEYNITAKSGTTLTLNANVRYKHKVGSIVQKLSREFTIKGIDNNSGTRPFLYVEYWTDFTNAHTRHIHLKNVRFTNWGGNTNSTYYRGVMIAGYNSELREDSSENRYAFQTTIQGVVVDNTNNRTSYCGISLRHSHGITQRNNICYNTGAQGMWYWSSQHNVKCYNNYITRTSYTSLHFDSLYEPYSEISYNYGTRSDDYGFMIHQIREPYPIRHNIMINHENRAFYTYYTVQDAVIERLYLDGMRYMPYVGIVSHVQFLDCYFDNRWFKSIYNTKYGSDNDGLLDADNYLAYAGTDGRAQSYRTNGHSMRFESYEHNFNYDEKLSYYGSGFTLEDSTTGNIMKAYNCDGSDYAHYKKQIYVPANVTVRISSEMKLQEGGSYSAPYLFATKITGYSHAKGRWRTQYSGQTSTRASNSSEVQNMPYYTWRETNSFSTSTKGTWQEKQLTLQPQDKGYFLVVGIGTKGDSAQEIHEMKDINVFFDETTPIKKVNTLGKGVSKRASFSRAKKRIGGTRL
jgi:hypothetical protein